jgi:hypothetical protein
MTKVKPGFFPTIFLAFFSLGDSRPKYLDINLDLCNFVHSKGNFEWYGNERGSRLNPQGTSSQLWKRRWLFAVAQLSSLLSNFTGLSYMCFVKMLLRRVCQSDKMLQKNYNRKCSAGKKNYCIVSLKGLVSKTN